MRFIIVHGTGDPDPFWASPVSPLRVYLHQHGWMINHHPHGPFHWSGEVGGLFWFMNRKDWPAGAEALRYYARGLEESEPLVILSHSHGAQLVVRAASKGLRVHTWIDVSGPIRGDTLAIYPQAKTNLRKHVYVHDESRWGDWTKIGGQLFDGAFGFPVRHPYAHTSIGLKGVGHSGVLTNPAHFHFWAERILPAAQS